MAEKKLKIFLTVTECNDKPDGVKRNSFLHYVGDEAQEFFLTFELEEAVSANNNQVFAAFEQYCVSKKNESVCRQLFFNATREMEIR